MPDDRVHVWVQRFKDRKHLMLQWIDPDTGKRKSKSAETDDEDKAEQARADHEYELNHGKYQEASRMTWERFRDLFEEEYLPGVRKGTRKCLTNVLNLFERVCNPKRLSAVNERTVSAFVAGLRKLPIRGGKVGMEPYTVHVRVRLLHVILNWAAGQKLIPACPKFPTVKVPKRRPQPIPAESFERLLAKAPDLQTQAFLLCGWLAGLRLNEAFCLEKEQTDEAPYISADGRRIVLPAGFVKAAEDQWVPLDPVLRDVLESLSRHGKRVFHFTDARDGHPVLVDTVGHRVVDLAKKAGVKLSMHSLRKGFGCRYAGKVPAQVLQRLMRHSNIRITMDYYANVDDAVMEAVFGAERNSPRNTPSPVPRPVAPPHRRNSFATKAPAASRGGWAARTSGPGRRTA
jgi:integrase